MISKVAMEVYIISLLWNYNQWHTFRLVRTIYVAYAP